MSQKCRKRGNNSYYICANVLNTISNAAMHNMEIQKKYLSKKKRTSKMLSKNPDKRIDKS